MATSPFKKFIGSVLFVMILQATDISALECYECHGEHDQECNEAYLPDKFLITEPSSNETFQNEAHTVKEILIAKEIKFTKGPYCVKWWQAHRARTGAMFRYIMAEAPVASNLDQSGCISTRHDRICFCNQEKCNNGRILQFNDSSDLECYGCKFNGEREDDKRCLEDNPPKEFLSNLTTLILETYAKTRNFFLVQFHEFRMRPGPFCVKSKMHDQEVILRGMSSEAPESIYLDESGCMEVMRFRVCFCNHDKCNGGPDFQPLRCYGCVVGADKELADYNREECIEANPPDELLVNETGGIPSFENFARSISNDTLNSLEKIRGPVCVKVLDQGERFIFRYVMPVGVHTKHLDEFGCMVSGGGRQICFCNKDKCNDGC